MQIVTAITEEIIEGEEDETITVKSPLGSAIADTRGSDHLLRGHRHRRGRDPRHPCPAAV